MKFYFAPLEGITGFIYRNAYFEEFGGLDKYYAPFVSPSANERMGGKEIKDLLQKNNNPEINLIPQILANNPEYFIKAAKQIMEMGYTEEININIGCPSGTVVSKKKGAGFLTELEAMDSFFEKIFDWRQQYISNLNISVKTRIGMESSNEFEKILEIYNRYPISELTIHPRTRQQMYKDVPDLDIFEYATKESKIPLCYNGDINTVQDYQKIIHRFDVDAVMIGRGLIRNPNLVNEIKGGEKLNKEMLRRYHDRLYKDFEPAMKADKHLLYKMLETWTYMSLNFENPHKCLKIVRKAQNLYKYQKAVDEIFDTMELEPGNI